jgi:hypothetical protein
MDFFLDTWYADRSPLTVYFTIHNKQGDATIDGYQDDQGYHDGTPERPLLMGLASIFADARDYAYYNWED